MTPFTPLMQLLRPQAILLLVFGLGLGYLAGLGSANTAAVRADITEEPRREAFKPAAGLNEPILREIAATLVRIEARVERIERGVAPTATNVPAGSTRKKDSVTKKPIQ